VIVGVKQPALAEALSQLNGFIGPDTVVLSLLNGVTSEHDIAQAFPQAHVLLSISLEVDPVRRGSAVEYTTLGRLVLGEPHNQQPWSPAVQFATGLLDRAGLAWEVAEDMTRQLWFKFLINAGVNQVTAALGGAPYAVVQADSPARQLMLAAQREVIACAQAQGIDLRDSDLDAWLDILAKLGPGQYTSMAQDVLAGRPTETDMFGGVIRQLGESLGLAVPVNTVLHQLLSSRAWLPTADQAGRIEI